MIKDKKPTKRSANSKPEVKAKSAKLLPGKTATKNVAAKQKQKPNTAGKNVFKKSPAAQVSPKKGSGNFNKNVGKFGTNKFAGKSKAGHGATDGDANEKKDWRKFKEEKKQLKLIRKKKTNDSYEISVEAKKIYEKLKCRRTEKKSQLVEKLYNLFNTGDVLKKVVMAHDTARIVQCMLKFAAPALREEISEHLLPIAVDMSTSKYSHFCVLRMFKYGSPGIKSKLVDSFFGHIVKLACHNISSKILDHAYLNVANEKQKIYMRQEFYGDLYKRSKDANVKGLSDAYKDMESMKASILGAVKSNLEHVANKNLVDSSLVHAVILEYIRVCDEDKIEETVSAYAPLVPMMLSTKDGTQAAIICFYKASTKNRRAIVKGIKDHLVKICTHEHGHLFIIAVLNALDDTKATKKAIFDSIYTELQTLMSNKWGRQVVEWLVAPADTCSFHPKFIADVEEGLKYSKKDKDLRRKEVLEQIEAPLAEAITADANFWLSNKNIALVTAQILKKLSNAHFEAAATALASVISAPDWQVELETDADMDEQAKEKKPQDVEEIIAAATKLKKQKKRTGENSEVEITEAPVKPEQEKVVGIEEAGMHVVLKKILKHDKERLEQGADSETFGSLLAAQLPEETLQKWLSMNRGCFVLLLILENNGETTGELLKSKLNPLKEELKAQKSSGAKLLLKKLSF